MKKVRISFFLKFLVFLIQLFLLIHIILLPITLESSYFITPFLIYCGLALGFISVLKNSLLGIKIFGFLLVFFLVYGISGDHIFNIIKNDFLQLDRSILFYSFVVGMLLFCFIYILLYSLYKKINTGENYVAANLLTERKQETTFIFLQVLLIIGITFFRFGYYDIGRGISEISDEFFVTKFQNKNIENDNNLYYAFRHGNYIGLDGIVAHKTDYELIKIKEDISRCLYENICFGLGYHTKIMNIYEGKITDSIALARKDFHINIVCKGGKECSYTNRLDDENAIIEVKKYLRDHLDILSDGTDSEAFIHYISDLEDIYSKKHYYKNLTEYDSKLIYKNLIKFNRILKYYILFLLENEEEEKAVVLLSSQIQMFHTILEGDTSAVEILFAEKLLGDVYDTLLLSVDNFELPSILQRELIMKLRKPILVSFLDNALKNEYKSTLSLIDKVQRHKNTLFDIKESTQMLKNHYLTSITYKQKISKKYFLPSEKEMIDGFLKSNQLGKILTDIPYVFQRSYEKLEELETFRKRILHKMEGRNEENSHS